MHIVNYYLLSFLRRGWQAATRISQARESCEPGLVARVHAAGSREPFSWSAIHGVVALPFGFGLARQGAHSAARRAARLKLQGHQADKNSIGQVQAGGIDPLPPEPEEGFADLAMDEGAPSAPGCLGDVFGAIVEVDDIGAGAAGGLLEGFVNGRVRFHDALLVREDPAIELVEERVSAADEIGLELVGVREYPGGVSMAAEAGVKLDHGFNGGEDIAEIALELGPGSAIAGGFPEGFEEFVRANAAGFEVEQSGRLGEGLEDGCGIVAAIGGEAADHDLVIEIEEDLAEIEGDDGQSGGVRCDRVWRRGGRGIGHWRGLRFSMAWRSVSSSANSRLLPTGRPWARRVMRAQRPARRRAR